MSSLRARLIPLSMLLAAGLAWLASRNLEIWTIDGPGPGLVPKVAIALMAVLALALAVTGSPAPAEDADQPAGVSRTFVIYALAAAGMAVAVPWFGFVLPALVCVLVILRFAEDRSRFASVAYSFALIGTIVLLFGTALNVQFPDGIAERALKMIRLL